MTEFSVSMETDTNRGECQNCMISAETMMFLCVFMKMSMLFRQKRLGELALTKANKFKKCLFDFIPNDIHFGIDGN